MLPCVWEHGRTWPFLLCRTLVHIWAPHINPIRLPHCWSTQAHGHVFVGVQTHADLKLCGLVCSWNESTRHCLASATQVDVFLWHSSSVHGSSALVARVAKVFKSGWNHQAPGRATFLATADMIELNWAKWEQNLLLGNLLITTW